MTDPYLDEDTGILRNILGARTTLELDNREAQLVFAAELDIEYADISETADMAELCAIHKHLFKHVFDWAGQIRTVDIRKNHDNAEFFLPMSKIRDAAQFVFSELAKENFLSGMEPKDFVGRLAYHYDQLNYIHPFREGNGRAQRLFWTRVAGRAGFEINWLQIVGEENNEACRVAAEEMNTAPLIEMFERIVSKS